MNYIDMQIEVVGTQSNKPHMVKVRDDATYAQLKQEIYLRFEKQLPQNTNFLIWEKKEKRNLKDDVTIEQFRANQTLVFGDKLPPTIIPVDEDSLKTTETNITRFELYQPDTDITYNLTYDTLILGREDEIGTQSSHIAKIELKEKQFANFNYSAISRNHAVFVMDSHRRDFYVMPFKGSVWLNTDDEELTTQQAVRLQHGDKIYLLADQLYFEFREIY